MHAIEDLNVVESTEQDARGGASVTVLAPPVLALELIDLLRSLAERLSVDKPKNEIIINKNSGKHVPILHVDKMALMAALILAIITTAHSACPANITGFRSSFVAESFDPTLLMGKWCAPI